MSSVLFRTYRVRYVSTHVDGSALRKLVASVAGVFRTWRELLVGRPRLVHVHLASRASFWRKLLAIWPAWILRIPVLVHLHGAEFRDFHGKEAGALGRALIEQTMVRSARVVALSGQWKAWLERQFPAVQAVVIPNSVSLPADREEVAGSPPVLLFMGRLGARKGSLDLVRAFAHLSDTALPPRLILAGDGDIAEARVLAEELGVADRVETPGWIGGADKAALLRRATVYVLPSYNEGLPMSVLEAMAHGLPVVTTPVGGIPDAIRNGEEGFLVQPGDVATLADRLRQLIETPALAATMGRAGRRTIRERFATDATAKHWLALYAALCTPRKHAADRET